MEFEEVEKQMAECDAMASAPMDKAKLAANLQRLRGMEIDIASMIENGAPGDSQANR